MPIRFAIENIDLVNDTPEHKHEFHGTGQIFFQEAPINISEKLDLNRSRNPNLSFEKDLLTTSKRFIKTNPSNETFPNLTNAVYNNEI